MNTKTAVYSLNDVGCYVDGARGIYAIDAILDFTESHGQPKQILDMEFANAIEDECDDYMNDKYSVEGAYWGRNENGDWGLWTIDED